MNNSAHCFALYTSLPLSNVIREQAINFRDENLWMRITRVLRLQAGEEVILFDDLQSIRIFLHAQMFQNKGVVVGSVIKQSQHQPLFPRVNLCIGLLKKESLEEVVYYATAMGVASIVPVATEKVHRSWGGEKELSRLFKIMVAAAEQSKQFIFPKIIEPLSLQEFLISDICTMQPQQRVFFDVKGAPLLTKLTQYSIDSLPMISLFFGPEGGLVDEEIASLQEKKFCSIALTPTILRAADAVAVGLGAIRSCLSV